VEWKLAIPEAGAVPPETGFSSMSLDHLLAQRKRIANKTKEFSEGEMAGSLAQRMHLK
jgi:hypothetical protein